MTHLSKEYEGDLANRMTKTIRTGLRKRILVLFKHGVTGTKCVLSFIQP